MNGDKAFVQGKWFHSPTFIEILHLLDEQAGDPNNCSMQLLDNISFLMLCDDSQGVWIVLRVFFQTDQVVIALVQSFPFVVIPFMATKDCCIFFFSLGDRDL